jgi:hypothetical protein
MLPPLGKVARPRPGEATVQLDAKPITVSRPVRIAAGQVVNDVRMQTHLNGWFVTAPRLPISLRAISQDVHLLG